MLPALLASQRMLLLYPTTLRVLRQARFSGKETLKTYTYNHFKCLAVDNKFHHGKTKCVDEMELLWDVIFKKGSG